MESIIRKKAVEMILSSETCVLGSIDEDGYPRAVTMSTNKAEGMETIWLSTGTDSEKVKHYKENNKASISYCDGNNGITLSGTIEIVVDMDIKKALWMDWYINHFSGGVTDPNYCILKFNTNKAVLWIDNVFERITLV